MKFVVTYDSHVSYGKLEKGSTHSSDWGEINREREAYTGEVAELREFREENFKREKAAIKKVVSIIKGYVTL